MQVINHEDYLRNVISIIRVHHYKLDLVILAVILFYFYFYKINRLNFIILLSY